ncbi:hypothetical protein [Dyadobacter arcticus]|uniref:Lipocalin-like domain-containing protein n=1 Tax=Dyadobacter arcticus TaxID=1078754 RepID=A0ABX0UIZ2_9BACT|nr:hypothetical protein [Dyadobacter arcticus]NIJ52777.1 hypothetical protein [Dyadobacter arcticus]
MKKILVVILTLAFANAFSQSKNLLNVPSKTTTRIPVAEGANIWGVFHGRVRCQEMAEELKMPVESTCEKLKWSFTFFQDPATGKLTTYKWEGSLFRDKAMEGQCIILKGTPNNPDAVVVQLNPDKPDQSLFLLKGEMIMCCSFLTVIKIS